MAFGAKEAKFCAGRMAVAGEGENVAKFLSWAQAEADRIEALYSEDDLLRLIRAHGVDETLNPNSPTPSDSDSQEAS